MSSGEESDSGSLSPEGLRARLPSDSPTLAAETKAGSPSAPDDSGDAGDGAASAGEGEGEGEGEAEDEENQQPTKKRKASSTDPNQPKTTKRRAARACVSCRARKVRCDVVEHNPCGNCRWDNVACVVQESRRRKKNLYSAPVAQHPMPPSTGEAMRAHLGFESPMNMGAVDNLGRPNPINLVTCGPPTNLLGATLGPGETMTGHMPHPLYQQSAASISRDPSMVLTNSPSSLFGGALLPQGQAPFLGPLDEVEILSQLPPFVKPLPTRIEAEDVRYLQSKGALSLPPPRLQHALAKAYVEYVHPYMPMIDIHDFLRIIDNPDGCAGQVSLFMYQAVMFAATSFVDIRDLRAAGFQTRKLARKAAFTRARLLYDFDYESDRLVLVQGMLLMTYWYETPDDQKDTWHWMGVAISLAHTIGLHRNPTYLKMPPKQMKAWKRIWWSCFMRDRLIALGMRRPTRIKDEDFDVPMLEESDFEIEAFPEDSPVLRGCTLIRNEEMQRSLAMMCIEKAKLCICISHMLKAQYSVLTRDNVRPDHTSSMMLLPNKTFDNGEAVKKVDGELKNWVASLPSCCRYRPLMPVDVKDGHATLALQRNLLHMIYQTTVSALHRPQFMSPDPSRMPGSTNSSQEHSRTRVREAAAHTTRMAAELKNLDLDRFLPTTGVTAMLPAMIIHLLDMKNPLPEARAKAQQGFNTCMRVLENLRTIYAAADFATNFLHAALRKIISDAHTAAQLALATSGHIGALPTRSAGRGAGLNGMLAPALNLRTSTTPRAPSTPPPEGLSFLGATQAGLLSPGQPAHASQPMFLLGGPTASPLVMPTTESPPQSDPCPDSPASATTVSTGASFYDDLDPVLNNQRGAAAVGHLVNPELMNPASWNVTGGNGGGGGNNPPSMLARDSGNIDFAEWIQFPAEGVSVDAGFLASADVGETVGGLPWMELPVPELPEPLEPGQVDPYQNHPLAFGGDGMESPLV